MSQVNSMSSESFIEVFGNIIEHCSLVAAAVVRYRPFSSLQHLHEEICTFIDQLPDSGEKILCLCCSRQPTPTHHRALPWLFFFNVVCQGRVNVGRVVEVSLYGTKGILLLH